MSANRPNSNYGSSSSSSSGVSSGEHGLNEHNVLYKNTLRDFLELSLNAAGRSVKVCRNILQDVMGHNSNWPGYESDMSVLNNYVQQTESILESEPEQNLSNILAAIGNFIENVHRLYTKAQSNTSSMGKLKESFEKNGFQELTENIRRDFVKFFDRFTMNFEQYAKQLNETDKQNQMQLFNWFKVFQGQNDFRAKFVQFQEFFRFFKTY